MVIKSLDIIKKNEISGYISFIDIGLKKSSLTIFKNKQLLFINNTHIVNYNFKHVFKINF